MVLTGDQIRAFHVSGFLAIVEPVIDSQELTRPCRLYDRMFAERVGRTDGNQFDLAGADDEDGRPASLSQILYPHRYFLELQGAYAHKIHDIMRQLLGSEIRTEIFHAILKPAEIGVATPRAAHGSPLCR